MGNIFRHTGINIGGLNPVSWIYPEDVAIFNSSDSSLYCLIVPKSGKSWNAMYGTPETIQLESEQQDTPGGMKYLYKLKVLVPKDRIAVEAELFRMTGRRLILKVGDKNGTVRILGTMESPMKLTSKLLKPAVLEAFNGYELYFAGEFSKPAGFQLVSTNGIPEGETED